MQHILALSRCAVVVRHWFEIDLGDASMEHGARVELRLLAARPHRGSESAAQLIAADRPLWRADLFDRLGDPPGSFGGLAFVIGGNMAVAASGQGGVMVRVDPAESEMLTGTTSAEVAIWHFITSLRVDAKTVQRWVTQDPTPHRSTAYKVAKLLDVPQTLLWPGLDADSVGAAREVVVAFYPHRADTPK